MPTRFFAITELDSNGKIQTSNLKRVFYAFELPFARPVSVHPQLKTHIWFHPLDGNFHIQETASGSFLGSGISEESAITDTVKRINSLKDPQLLFRRLESFGRLLDHPQITFDEAIRRQRVALANPKPQKGWRLW